ncbi:MAG: polyphosphate kinase 2 family protein [Phycisphaerae bacterium]|nr:polyphosphate kinase 2 family protein [Phycisphaerae bacterium]
MSRLDTSKYCVGREEKRKDRFRLRDVKTDDDGGLEKDAGKAAFERAHARLIELQQLFYADGRFALCVVFQAMDTGGKDGTIRDVFGGVNPAGCRVTSFKAPNDVELRHDFLWRIHQHTPRLGHFAVFNRSHYEDVLVARVKKLVPSERWKPRFEHINTFERMLFDEGTRIVKFLLHISRDYQRERLLRRLHDPAKQWKFDPQDVAERARWDDYQQAYEEVLNRCSTAAAPWYVVPAEHHWFRNLLVTQVLVETIESLPLAYPKPSFDPSRIVID